LHNLVGQSESNNMESALREALEKVESQAIRVKKKMQATKRQPKEEKKVSDPQLARPRKAAKTISPPDDATGNEVSTKSSAKSNGNGNGHARQMIPVTVHSFPARVPIAEPHVVKSTDSVALRPMTLEEAVKEAEFKDREVFVFRDNAGNVRVLHRKRDGKMELIEA